jgi:Flp pilus assembly protein protease CpaA
MWSPPMDLHKIPNWMSGGVAVLFYAYALATGMAPGTIMSHTLAALAMIVIGFVTMRGSAGAVKLTAAVVLWLGLPQSLVFIALSYGLCGAVGYLVQFTGKRDVMMPYLPFAAIAVAIMLAEQGLPGLIGG